jgi:phage baseplate assembly protein W
MASNTSILGRGLKFPLTLSASGLSKTGADSSQEEAHVFDSIKQILGTPVGSRVMRRDFGSRLHEIPFEPQDESTVSLIKHFVADAIGKWEPRVEVVRVDIQEMDASTGKVLTLITVRFLKTNRMGNLVYPHYMTMRGEV